MKKLIFLGLLLFLPALTFGQPAADDLIISQQKPSGTGSIQRYIDIGSAGQVLTSNGPGLPPSMQDSLSGVSSVFGRTGAVAAEAGDYASFYGQLDALNVWTSVNTYAGSFIFTPATITITANSGPWDIDNGFSRATNGADTTLVMSAGGTDGQNVYLNAVNSDTAAHTWTIDNPSGTDPTFTAAANQTTAIKLQSNGTVWTIIGGAPTINDITTIAPASGDFLSLWDLSGGVTIKAAASTFLALYDSQAATMTNKKVQLSAALAVDDTYDAAAEIAGLNAGATIAQWEAVYVGGSSTYLLADANGSSTYPALGLAVAAYSSTNPAIILVRGTVRNDAWTWTPGGAIYLSGTPGALTQTAPSTSGDKVQRVGTALTADIAFFDFDSTYVTVQ